MEEQEIIHRLALQKVKTIGAVRYKSLIRYFGSATAVFHNKDRTIDTIENIGQIHFNAINAFVDFAAAEKEYQFIKRNEVQV